MSFTVLTAEFQHESNTFSRVATGLEEFRARYFLEGEAALRERGDANTPLAGFLDVARPQGWRVIHPLSAGATPAGPVTRKAYETLVEIIVGAAWREVGRIDGVLLGLHGAMVTEHLEDGEGELLSRLRAALGPEVPIAITLDPHANVTKAMTREAQIIVGYKTYPHVDMRACGAHAASVLDRAMKGEIRPITVRACAPMLEEATGGRTDVGPMVERIARARAYETEPDVFVVSVNGGFGLADIREVGPTVLVTCQGDHKRHRAFARSLAQDMWERRLETVTHFLTVEEAAARAQTFEATHGPLVIADYADNPGGGGYGDSTTLLAALLAAGVKDAALGGLVDPQAVAELSRARRGDVVRLAIGGKTDPLIGGGPLAVEGEVMARRADGRRAQGKFWTDLRAARRRDRRAADLQRRAVARPWPVPRVRDRADAKARRRGQVDAAFPRGVRARGGRSDRVRRRGTVHAGPVEARLCPRAPPDLSSGPRHAVIRTGP